MNDKLKTFEEFYGGEDYNQIRDEEDTDISMDTEVDDELADNIESLIDRFGLGKVKNFFDKITR